jgi:hypothetical protein
MRSARSGNFTAPECFDAKKTRQLLPAGVSFSALGFTASTSFLPFWLSSLASFF